MNQFRSVLAVMTLIVLPVSAALHTSQIPPTIDSPISGNPPAWVATEAAMTPTGSLRVDMLGSPAVARLHDYVQQQREAKSRSVESDSTGCGGRVLSVPIVEHHLPAQSLDDLVDNARSIFRGRIAEIQAGFLYGRPGSLLRIESPVALRDDGSIDLAHDVYLFYPFARIRAEGGLICAGPMMSDYEPAVGDELLVFGYLPAVDPGRHLVQVNVFQELVAASAGGTLHLPQLSLQSDPAIHDAKSLERIATLVSRRLRQRERTPPEVRP